MSKKSRARNEKIWFSQFFRRQKDINGYARKALCPRSRDDVIGVFHPDEYRRWISNGPCPECPVSHFCNKPCQPYLNWYDERMKLARQILTGQQTEGR